jgi:hypothetical protein
VLAPHDTEQTKNTGTNDEKRSMYPQSPQTLRTVQAKAVLEILVKLTFADCRSFFIRLHLSRPALLKKGLSLSAKNLFWVVVTVADINYTIQK